MSPRNPNVPSPIEGKGSNPFETIRRVDAYGREYWVGRDLQPLMEYSRWEDFDTVIEKAKSSLALVQGPEQAEHHFGTCRSDGGRWGNQQLDDYRMTRFGAYLVALAGDATKPAVAHARIYFAVKTREAELGALVVDDINRTALARAREMIDYRTFRDMMADTATDYEPSSKDATMFFACMQNKLYRHITGSSAAELRGCRELETWPGREEGKPEPSEKAACRNVAKNYLTSSELSKLNRLVGVLCLTAEEYAEDGVSLSLAQWEQVGDTELELRTRRLAA